MPPKGSPLASDGEVVHKVLPWLNRALGYISRPVCPASSYLPDPMPTPQEISMLVGTNDYFRERSTVGILDLPVDGEIVFHMVDHFDKDCVILSGN